MVLEIEDLGRSEKRVERAGRRARACRPAARAWCWWSRSRDDAQDARAAARRVRACASTADAARRARAARLGRAPAGAASVSRPSRGVLETLRRGLRGRGAGVLQRARQAVRVGRPASAALTPAEVAAICCARWSGAELPDYLAAVAAGDPARAAQRLGRLLAAGMGEGTHAVRALESRGRRPGRLGALPRARAPRCAAGAAAARAAAHASTRCTAPRPPGRAAAPTWSRVLEQRTRVRCAARPESARRARRSRDSDARRGLISPVHP